MQRSRSQTILGKENATEVERARTNSAVPEQRLVTSVFPVNTPIKMGIFFKGACPSAQSQCVPQWEG